MHRNNAATFLLLALCTLTIAQAQTPLPATTPASAPSTTQPGAETPQAAMAAFLKGLATGNDRAMRDNVIFSNEADSEIIIATVEAMRASDCLQKTCTKTFPDKPIPNRDMTAGIEHLAATTKVTIKG